VLASGEPPAGRVPCCSRHPSGRWPWGRSRRGAPRLSGSPPKMSCHQPAALEVAVEDSAVRAESDAGSVDLADGVMWHRRRAPRNTPMWTAVPTGHEPVLSPALAAAWPPSRASLRTEEVSRPLLASEVKLVAVRPDNPAARFRTYTSSAGSEGSLHRARLPVRRAPRVNVVASSRRIR